MLFKNILELEILRIFNCLTSSQPSSISIIIWWKFRGFLNIFYYKTKDLNLVLALLPKKNLNILIKLTRHFFASPKNT